MSATTLSEVFRDAQQYLWGGTGKIKGKKEFICHAASGV